MAASGIAIFGSLIGMLRLAKPRVLPEASSRFRVGKPGDIRPGTSQLIPEQNVRLVRTDEGIAAMSLICTHLGCIVSEMKEGFECPCHGSKFSAGGDVVAGPAPRALPWLSVSQTPDGSIVVDKSKEVAAGNFFHVA
jgi:Rieske Fe-S protein